MPTSTTFQSLVNRLAATEDFQINTHNTQEFPGQYKVAADAIINTIKPKLDILDKITLPFIENAFSDLESVKNKLDSIGGDVPDGLIENISVGLYDEDFNDISSEKKDIIKVLATYICIQA